MKTYVHTKTSTWTFTAALFLSAKKWEPPACPFTDTQKRKCGISRQRRTVQSHKETKSWHTSQHMWTLKTFCETTWKKPDIKGHVFYSIHVKCPEQALRSTGTENRSVVVETLEGTGRVRGLTKDAGFFGGWYKFLELDLGAGCTTPWYKKPWNRTL